MSAPSYYVVCIDYGRGGREAVVNPEMTRSGALALVREIANSYDRSLDFVHHVADGHVEDITTDILGEALDQLDESDPIDHQALAFDHVRDLRKHEERA